MVSMLSPPIASPGPPFRVCPNNTARVYPTFGGALVCANKAGEHGAARHGLSFAYSYQGPGQQGPQIAHAIEVDEKTCGGLQAIRAQHFVGQDQ